MSNMFDLDDMPELVDPLVHVHLMSGNILGLQNVSITEITKRLYSHGFVFMSDGEGSYAVLFDHGVAALTTS
jgi:hypothetical protein